MLPNEKYKLQTPIKGIDVSSWQGHIDWAKVKAAGVKFAILRAGYGRYSSQKDARFEEYYAGCKPLSILSHTIMKLSKALQLTLIRVLVKS